MVNSSTRHQLSVHQSNNNNNNSSSSSSSTQGSAASRRLPSSASSKSTPELSWTIMMEEGGGQIQRPKFTRIFEKRLGKRYSDNVFEWKLARKDEFKCTASFVIRNNNNNGNDDSPSKTAGGTITKYDAGIGSAAAQAWAPATANTSSFNRKRHYEALPRTTDMAVGPIYGCPTDWAWWTTEGQYDKVWQWLPSAPSSTTVAPQQEQTRKRRRAESELDNHTGNTISHHMHQNHGEGCAQELTRPSLTTLVRIGSPNSAFQAFTRSTTASRSPSPGENTTPATSPVAPAPTGEIKKMRLDFLVS